MGADVLSTRLLGKGRAAQVFIVELETEVGPLQAVEKHFNPQGLTRTIYKTLFFAPFPYATNPDAVLSCLYRRRILKAILSLEDPHKKWLADGLYVRRCERGHYVLGTELIRGRPVAPPRPQEGPEAAPNVGADPGEMSELLVHMRRLERLLLRTGFTGSGWQVAPAAMVTTANFLRVPWGGFVLVDLESGIPAFLAPKYLWLSLSGHPLPLFDDATEPVLRQHLERNRGRLREQLGETGAEELTRLVDAFFHHLGAWKRSEPAPGRHRIALILDKDLRQTIRSDLTRRWESEERLDAPAAARLNQSGWFLLHPLIILGALPTSVGRLVHRLAGNRVFRKRAFHTVMSLKKLNNAVRTYQTRKVARLIQEQRIPKQGISRLQCGLTSLPAFCAHQTLARFTRRPVHRFLADWSYAGAALRAALLAPLSGRIQEQIAQTYLERVTRRWADLGRLDEKGRCEIVSSIDHGGVQDHLKGFGAHLGLKLFQPLTTSLKVIGVAMFVISPWNPLAVALALNTSIARTLLTTLVWIRQRSNGASYTVAFTVGIIPVLGTLAFPIQFYRNNAWLSRFLIRVTLSQLSELVPIYGGRATRLEHALVRSSELILFLLTAVTWQFSWTRQWTPQQISQQTTGISHYPRWWNRQVNAALGWLKQEPSILLEGCARH